MWYPMAKTIRWGIIGCGDVTEVKSGPGFQLAENSELVAVMRRNGALAEDYAKRHGVPKWYDDAKALIDDSEVDAVYIATPPAFHEMYTEMCAKAGKPVYVEKPMAMTPDACERMITACKATDTPLFVAFYRRGMARFHKIKALIESGAIGDVRFVTIRNYEKPAKEILEGTGLPWRVQPEIAGGGIFMDIACHTLDIFDFILGPIKTMDGLASNQAALYKAEDIVSANLIFESGVQGTGIWCFSAFENYDMNEIVGTKGRLQFSTFGSEPIELYTEKGMESFEVEHPKHVQQPLIQMVVNDLNGGEKSPSTGESALRTSLLMDKIIKPYYTEK